MIAGKFFELVGDGMASGTAADQWERDSWFSTCFGGFGYVTTQGDTIPDNVVEDVTECLTSMYAGQADPDEEDQG